MRTYKRIGCTIEIEEQAEKWLLHNNINVDSYANHLYLFSDNFPMDGNKKIIVNLSRTYTGEGQLFIRLERFKLPKYLVPESLTCDKSKEPPCHLEPSENLCSKCSLNSGKEMEK
jgi:hypothetical protein